MSGLVTRRSAIIGAGAALAAPQIARARPSVWTPPRGLEYPAGRKPGFDPTHPATAGCRFSGVATGSGFSNILLGSKVAIGGSPLYMQTPIGPTLYNDTTGNGGFGSATIVYDTSPSVVNFAAIINIVTAQGAAHQTGILSVGQTSAWTGFGGFNGTKTGIFVSGSAYYTTGMPILPGIWFTAVSINAITSTIIVVLTNLATGSTQYQTIAGPSSIATPNQALSIGTMEQSATFYLNGGVASGMYAVNNPLSLSTIIAWAQNDPWGFWYQ